MPSRFLILILVLAAGCGATKTVHHTTHIASPPTTVNHTPEECRAMGLKLVDAITNMRIAAQTMAKLVPAAYKAGYSGSGVDGIVAKMGQATARAKASTASVNAATALVDRCFR